MMYENCPLPIDWLDFLEEEGSSLLATHLAECVSCQRVVASLKERAAGVRLGDWTQRLSTAPVIRWQETRPARVTFGQIWLTASSLDVAESRYQGLERIPVLTLDNLRDEDGHAWVTAVPLTTDTDSATEVDLLLQPTESSLNIPLRVLFRLQTILERRQLDTCVGELTDIGGALLRQVLDGDAPPTRFGPPLEAAEDPRLTADQRTAQVIGVLGGWYLRNLDADLHGLATKQAGSHNEGALLRFELKRRPSAGRTHALAAHTGGVPDLVYASLKGPFGVIEGYLKYQLFEDQLIFYVEAASGVRGSVQLILRSSLDPQPIESEPFVPARNQQIVVAQRRGISALDVEQLAIKVGG
jgi:hypothetical protein